MARTQGHGNPDWTRDEVILALDLYLDCDGRVPGAEDPRVVALSRLLQNLPIHALEAKNDRFRNPDGVVFKVGNLRSVATGRGLGNVAAVDRFVWSEFGDKPSLARVLAERIRSQVEEPEVSRSDIEAVDSDEEFAEGRIITALHKRRERHPLIRKKLLVARLKIGPLACDTCDFVPAATESMMIEAAFEAHHLEPLASPDRRERGTRVNDLALLCATCHRLIHRAMHLYHRQVSISELRRMLNLSRFNAAVSTDRST